MDGYQFPGLIIIDEDKAIKMRATQLELAILAVYPKHENTAISIHDVPIAIQKQYNTSIDIHGISKCGFDFLLQTIPGTTCSHMLSTGHLRVSTTNSIIDLKLMPWRADYGCIRIPAHTQLANQFSSNYNSLTYANNNFPKQISIDVAGIPPHLCNDSTTTALLNKVCNIESMTLDPMTHIYTVNGRTYCIDAIPKTAHVALRKLEASNTMLHVWPVWFSTTDFTDEDDIVRFHDEITEAERIGMHLNHGTPCRFNIITLSNAHFLLPSPAGLTYGASSDDIKPCDYSLGRSLERLAGTAMNNPYKYSYNKMATNCKNHVAMNHNLLQFIYMDIPLKKASMHFPVTVNK
jgi:hypothetical protein